MDDMNSCEATMPEVTMPEVMEKYIGTKIIRAEPMDECSFLRNFKGQDTSNRETRPGYKVKYPDDYISWSPQRQFEEAYRRTNAMSFGLAIEAIKKGHEVAREGWKGKNMYLGICEGGEFKDGYRTQDFIYMKTAADTIVPWLASQTDMLADDWVIAE